MFGSITMSVILAIIFLIIYYFGLINSYWLTMFAVIYLVIGFVTGFLLMGTEKENMKLGSVLIIVGVILILIIIYFPK